MITTKFNEKAKQLYNSTKSNDYILSILTTACGNSVYYSVEYKKQLIINHERDFNQVLKKAKQHTEQNRGIK